MIDRYKYRVSPPSTPQKNKRVLKYQQLVLNRKHEMHSEKIAINISERNKPHCRSGHRPKFHLARLDSTRLNSTRLTLSSQSSKSRRACRARRAVLLQHGGRRTILYKFSRFYALAYTNPICFIK